MNVMPCRYFSKFWPRIITGTLQFDEDLPRWMGCVCLGELGTWKEYSKKDVLAVAVVPHVLSGMNERSS